MTTRRSGWQGRRAAQTLGTVSPRHPSHALRHSGAGRPLVLLHGLGATDECWEPVVPMLRTSREVVVLPLPGFGEAAATAGPVTVDALADHAEALLAEAGLLGADLAGSSMGGEVVLELLRRGHGGHVVALAPSGYWGHLGRWWFLTVAWSAWVLVALLRSLVPVVVGSRTGRRLLLRPLSPSPGELPGVVVSGARTFARTAGFRPGLLHLGGRRAPVRVPRERTEGRRVTVVWGRRDGICLPSQAHRALDHVPGAELVWLERSGHLPMWDEPVATARVLLEATAEVEAREEEVSPGQERVA